MKLIVQIPCYNEAETLEIALNALPRHIEGIDTIEYLIINDGSVKIAVLAHTARSTRAILPKQESHLAGWLNSGWLN